MSHCMPTSHQVSSSHQALTYRISSKYRSIIVTSSHKENHTDGVWLQTFLHWVSMQPTHRRPRYPIKVTLYDVDWTTGLKFKSFTCLQSPQSVPRRMLVVLKAPQHSSQRNFSSGYHPSLTCTFLATNNFVNVNGNSGTLKPMMH